LGLFWSFFASTTTPKTFDFGHTSPAGPRRPPFNGQLTTDHQPIQLSKNTATHQSASLSAAKRGSGGYLSRPKQAATGRNPPDAPQPRTLPFPVKK